MIELPLPLRLTKAAASRKMTPEDLGHHLWRNFRTACDARTSSERLWDEVYNLYHADVADMQSNKVAGRMTTGDQLDWHHRINTGKTFEVVETLVAYLVGATFPSDDWFDVKCMYPDRGPQARLVKALAKHKLDDAQVRLRYNDIVRNWILYGVTTARVGWSSLTTRKVHRTFDETGSFTDTLVNVDAARFDISVMSPHDVWLDPGAKIMEGGTFARLRLSHHELADLVDKKYYDISEQDLKDYTNVTMGNPDYTKDGDGKTCDTYELIEYYGPTLYRGVEFTHVHAVWMNKRLVRLTDSEYWCGNPYVSAVMLPSRDSIYGMSVLHPNLGGLHILNVLTNARLDNLVLAINTMFEAVEDGILDIENIRSEPGRIHRVASKGNITPMVIDVSGAMVTYQEGQFQEAAIDKNIATGPMIGASQGRAGERVTATEIQGVKDAGGNRLTSVHSRLEDGFTYHFLSHAFTTLQQYYITPEVISVFDPAQDALAYYQVEGDILQEPYLFTPVGATYVVESARQMNDLLQLLDISGRVPQMAQLLDYKAIMADILKQMRFQQPDRYLRAETAEAAPDSEVPQQDPEMLGMEGDITNQAVQNEITKDGGASLLQAGGASTDGIPPEQLAMIMQQAQGAANGTAIPDPNVGTPIAG